MIYWIAVFEVTFDIGDINKATRSVFCTGLREGVLTTFFPGRMIDIALNS